MTAIGVREGWDRRGARSRLDRRRSIKELIKRQGLGGPKTFTDEDLRFRQLARRRQPAIHAVVFFMLDVSGSMSDRDRKLAKTFFFWVVQGLRREYRSLETVFVAHTTDAWEFPEAEFFQVTGTGGTVASTGLNKVREIIDARFNPSRHNIYLFYASDGDNSIGDHAPAAEALDDIATRPASQATWRLHPACRGSWPPRPGACSAMQPPTASRWRAMSSTISTGCGVRFAISSRPRPRQTNERLAQLRAAYGGAGSALGYEFSTRWNSKRCRMPS